MTNEELRGRMKTEPFAPIGATAEHRIAKALEYTAFYLGEIESHLSKIAACAEPNTTNLNKTQSHLSRIAEMLPTLLAK